MSDWYVILLNEIDEALTARKLPTRIVFIKYYDTNWAPLTLKIAYTKHEKQSTRLVRLTGKEKGRAGGFAACTTFVRSRITYERCPSV